MLYRHAAVVVEQPCCCRCRQVNQVRYNKLEVDKNAVEVPRIKCTRQEGNCHQGLRNRVRLQLPPVHLQVWGACGKLASDQSEPEDAVQRQLGAGAVAE